MIHVSAFFVFRQEKIQDLIDKQRKTLADVAYLDLDSVANIVNDFENPKLSEVNGIRFRTTYHGSASDFAKFDHTFMGTGEGMKGFYDKILPLFVSKYTKKWGAKVEDIELPKLEKSAQTMHAVNVTPEMKKV